MLLLSALSWISGSCPTASGNGSASLLVGDHSDRVDAECGEGVDRDPSVEGGGAELPGVGASMANRNGATRLGLPERADPRRVNLLLMPRRTPKGAGLLRREGAVKLPGVSLCTNEHREGSERSKTEQAGGSETEVGHHRTPVSRNGVQA